MKTPLPPLPTRSRTAQFDELDLAAVAECLRIVAHPVRLRLVDLLLAEDLTVGELAERLGAPQPVVSGHLRRLQAHRLLAPVRRGKNVYYHVTAGVLVDLCSCIHSHFTVCPAPAPALTPAPKPAPEAGPALGPADRAARSVP